MTYTHKFGHQMFLIVVSRGQNIRSVKNNPYTKIIIRSIKPSLYKFGYQKNKTSGIYEADERLTYMQAINFAKRALEKKHFAKEGSPKKVEVLDIMNTIASVKVTAWWGVDYILLSKAANNWMIEQVLWEGALQK